MVQLFISHSERDKELIEPLYKWLQCGLGLESEDIRCTSVENMDVGDTSMDTLRCDLKSAKAIIAVITSNSLRSHWVAMEMGAAWQRERLNPIRGPGMIVSELPSPLQGITTAGYCEEQAMQQMLQHLAATIDRPAAQSAKYELDEMIKVGERQLLQGITGWFSLPPVMAAWRVDVDRFTAELLKLCRQLNLEEEELHICTEANGYICRNPEMLPAWARDYWKLSKMAVNQLLKGDQDLLNLPRNVLSEQLDADLMRALSKRGLTRGAMLHEWFEQARQWVAKHPPQ